MRSGGITAFIALGSNLGDRLATLEAAIAGLEATPGLLVEAVSGIYETDPVGPPGQSDYLNAVARVRSFLGPVELLDVLLALEVACGRDRSGERERNSARRLDLDLLFFGDRCLRVPELELPHPRLHERAFVLTPLAELAPDWVHPRLGVSIRTLALEVHDPGTVRRFGPAIGAAIDRAGSGG